MKPENVSHWEDNPEQEEHVFTDADGYQTLICVYDEYFALDTKKPGDEKWSLGANFDRENAIKLRELLDKWISDHE